MGTQGEKEVTIFPGVAPYRAAQSLATLGDASFPHGAAYHSLLERATATPGSLHWGHAILAKFNSADRKH